jgi:hypothetical protein
MFFSRIVILGIFLVTLPLQAQAAPDNTNREVWVNEAIIATYTFNHKNFMARQKDIAKYFTAQGWINYTKAMQDSKLPESVEKNAYSVSAVATMPPEVTVMKDNQWQANMPVLVVYTNPDYKQKQILNIMLTFIEAPAGTGVRGFAITNLQAKVAQPPCVCAKESSVNAMA